MGLVELCVVDGSLVKQVKTFLTEKDKLDKSQKIRRTDDGFVISTLYGSLDEIDVELLENEAIRHQLVERSISLDNHVDKIELTVAKHLNTKEISQDQAHVLLSKIPKKYTLYPPLLLINNQDTFESPEWETHFKSYSSEEFYTELLQQFPKITHIAINKPIIEQDIMRRPFNISPLFGDFGPEPDNQMFDQPNEKDFQNAFWCTVVQNGIFQSWAPRYTMFSRGNIKEKARILGFKNVKGTDVVDMYAGIGYFTLSYLKLGARVFCFEINPWSIQGLIKGVEKNGFSYKVVSKDESIEWDENVQCWIFNESNEFAMERLRQTGKTKFNFSHVNMGLLPSSRQSWNTTLSIIDQYSNRPTIIHIHENEAIENLPSLLDTIASELQNLDLIGGSPNRLKVAPQHLEKIKTFAPGVWHICADFEISK